MPLSCLIIEDEPLARDILKRFITQIPELVPEGYCRNVEDAKEIISKKEIQLLFLDIHLPNHSGLDFLQSLDTPPLAIITTAYPEYAAEGFNLDVVDYLVKPISFSRFLKAVQKALNRHSTLMESPKDFIIKSEKRIYKISPTNILFIEGCGDYIKINLTNQSLLVHATLKEFHKKLPPLQFIRTHKSFIVALNHIDFVEGNQVRIQEHQIPISPNYKEQFWQLFLEE